MEPNVRSKIRDAILDMLFTKEEKHIQTRVDTLILEMNKTNPGNWYWFRGVKFSRQNKRDSLHSSLNAIPKFTPEMEEIYMLTEEFNYNKVILSSFVTNALNVSNSVMECFQIFPTCIRDGLNAKFNMAYTLSEMTEIKNHILNFLEKNKLNTIALKEQYTKSILL